MKTTRHACQGLSVLILITLLSQNLHAQVKIGSNASSINNNSVLELESSGKGFLLPRSTTSQINAMAEVPTGMLVFNTTDSTIYIRRDTGWVQLVVAQTGINATLRPVSPTAADIYAMMPDDNAAPIPSNGAILFPRTGAMSGGIARTSSSSLLLAGAGYYHVSYVLNIDEAAQVALFLNGNLLANTVAGKSITNSPLSSTQIIAVPSNSILELRNVSPTPITLTPNAGGTNPVSAHLAIVKAL